MPSPVSDDARTALDNVTLERRAALLPEDLAEPFIWLGCYIREECSRDIDIMVDRANKLGINIDKTNWSKIIRGKWDRDASDQKLEHPCVAKEKLVRAIELLRKDSRIKEQAGKVPFVETSTSKLIFDFIDAKRSPDRVCKMGVIIGETGSQKTASTREYCRQNNHGTCVWQDAPEKASLYKFKTQLAAAYGCNPQMSLARKEFAIQSAVNERKTIIIENIQRLYMDNMEGNQPVFNYLQWLQEITGCTIIMTFTPTFERKFVGGLNQGFFEQFVGRAGGTRKFLRLPAWTPEEDVLAIAQAFKVQEAKRHLDYLVKITKEPGRIRRLFEDLQDAKIAALADGKPLNIDYIREAREGN